MTSRLRWMTMLLGCTSVVSPLQADDAVEFGAYLSGECVTCHRSDSSSGAIPVLAGRNGQEILAALAAFKSGERPSPVMRDIAARLAEDEMSALATYFSSLPAPSGCQEASSQQKTPC